MLFFWLFGLAYKSMKCDSHLSDDLTMSKCQCEGKSKEAWPGHISSTWLLFDFLYNFKS